MHRFECRSCGRMTTKNSLPKAGRYGRLIFGCRTRVRPEFRRDGRRRYLNAVESFVRARDQLMTTGRPQVR
jgi:hypothetical protein